MPYVWIFRLIALAIIVLGRWVYIFQSTGVRPGEDIRSGSFWVFLGILTVILLYGVAMGDQETKVEKPKDATAPKTDASTSQRPTASDGPTADAD